MATDTSTPTTTTETTRSYDDAATGLWLANGTTVREHLYSYRGVLGRLATAEQVETFTATDGYDLFTCTVRLVSITSSRFIFTATRQQD